MWGGSERFRRWLGGPFVFPGQYLPLTLNKHGDMVHQDVRQSLTASAGNPIARPIFIGTFAAVALLFACLSFTRPAHAEVPSGDILIKGPGRGAPVYYLSDGGKRFVFPNQNTYLTWYKDFADVIEVSSAELSSFPLGGNVTYKPGIKLVKITTDPKVYAVDKGGILRWVTSENIAHELYGPDWSLKVDDVPDAFFANYSVGAAIFSSDDIDPKVIAANSGSPVAASLPAPIDGISMVRPLSLSNHVRGPRDAQVVLYVWTDLQCPFCQRFHPEMQQLLLDPKYTGKIAWVFRHFPLSFHPNAQPAANAAECAAEQGKFWEFVDDVFVHQDEEGDYYYGQLASKLTLDRKRFDSCYAAKKYDAAIRLQAEQGTVAGVSGTPNTVIVAKDGSRQTVPGAVPYENLTEMVDAALNK